MVAYLDHAATSPLRPEALEAMLPFLTEHFGNPSGSHAVARRAKTAIEDAREEIASLLGCAARQVVFTGSGTESDNLAILGSLGGTDGHGAHRVVACSAAEHHAVLDTVVAAGGRVIGVDPFGRIDCDELIGVLEASGPPVAAVSVMAVNNETGVISPVAEIAAAVRAVSPETLVHTDAVQALGAVPHRDLVAAADLVTLSAHKFGGPKGNGVLVVGEGISITPRLHGGGQERELRSGTHDVAGIVGTAAALRLASEGATAEATRRRQLRDVLEAEITVKVPGAAVTAAGTDRSPSISHLTIRGHESESLLFLLDEAGVCASAGSACASGAIEPSHVLAGMGVDRDAAAGALRFSLGATTTAADVDLAVKALRDAVDRLAGAR